ncbi:MAG: hypothetical protein NTV01_19775 [Bacteroidia bacterium]|nr:hypothetical protein [Bacteroidia bacterium]
MKTRKKGYKGLLALTVILTPAAIITLIPNAGASKANMIGYHSICSVVPMSTLVLVICAGATCYFRKKYFTK